MNTKTLNAQMFKFALESGVNNLANNVEKINSLNVFPVPDGDTGSNMLATINSAYEAIKNMDSVTLSDVVKETSKAMLFGARGNSGVILSQIFRGLSEILETKKEANVIDLVKAFENAQKKAYQSVLKPVEGTILTFIREVAQALKENITESNSIEDCFKLVVEQGKKTTINSPNLLKILKESGVTDSGSEGILLIFEGFNSFFSGIPIQRLKIEEKEKDLIFNLEHNKEEEFGYCTECIVDLKNPNKFNKNKIINDLEKHVKSIVIVEQEGYLKIHGHTLKPGSMLNYLQKYGEFVKIKSENMTLQSNQNSTTESDNSTNSENSNPSLSGLVSCNNGQGIISLMKQNGTDFIIEGGQTDNPSTQDIVTAINSVNAKSVFVLPNNSNIILAAQQAAKIVTNKKVIVIPTKNQVQGIEASLNFNKDTKWQDNKELIEESLGTLRVLEVFQASKDAKINNVKVKKDQFVAMENNKLLKAKASAYDVIIDTIESLITQDSEMIYIYYGDLATESEALEIQNYLEQNYDLEIVIKNGQQKIFNFLIGVV
ncbi:DAK2 domain-containing protein [Mycoplasma sp. 1654_15]|uniref:DAK2 domain-containing protein n=1 Tax=Mycoplasma sp. 1654_15 TaxID=2725994 RepID=UPI0014495977|nr:DAK2 domain-containing protein [Mycoplasma sp. 1654_15]QJB71111.1 DAK2 domain-containing protein [Mycoplasma sp. 1654_15]